jgi:hypothetical protein
MEIGAREVKIGGDVYVCPECGAENTAKHGEADHVAGPSADEGADANIGGSCDTCGALLTEENFVAAEMVTVPTAETRQRVPNGQEVVTIVGGLELKTPPWANEMHEYPYI